MSTTAKRVRCFKCNALVQREISDVLPYAVNIFKIDNKRGCICSHCIETLYGDFNSDLRLKFNRRKRSTLSEMMPTTSSDDSHSTSFPNYSVMQSPAEIILSALRQMQPISVIVSHAPKVSSHGSTSTKSNKPTSKDVSNDKYTCLNYSLDSYFSLVTKKVFGQDEAVKMLLYVIYYNQFANFMEEHGLTDDFIKKNHILLIGDTGTGKTFLSTTVAQTLNIPYAECNATAVTSAGYIGEKIEDFLERLFINAGYDLDKAENGIIFVDEFDKKRVNHDPSGRDVTGRAVQEELLKILEPSVIHLPKFHVDFNTKNLTVVLMGAHVGLDEIIDKRLKKKVIGFKDNSDEPEDRTVIQDDLINYGYIPEIVGRIPAIISLNKLSKSTVIDIIYSLLNKLIVFFKIKAVDLIIDDLFIDSIAEEILKSSTGARDVYSKFFGVFYPILYRVFQSKVGGICQIDALGNTMLIVNNSSGTTQTYNFESNFKFENADD